MWTGCKTAHALSFLFLGSLLATPAYAATGSTGPLAAFKAFFSHRQQPFLKRSQAYQLTLTAPTTDEIRAHFRIAHGYYLYRDKIGFRLIPPANGVTLGPVTMPPASVENNPVLGKLIIYKHSFTLPLPLAGAHKGESLAVRVHYQGCALGGICYPPVTRTISVALPGVRGPAPTAPAGLVPNTPSQRPVNVGQWIWAIAGAFGIGLLLTFTPCVLPMIPILSGMLVGSGRDRLTKTQGAKLSVAYVLGTGTTYAGAGALAGATGQQLQAYFENPWGIGLLSLLFVAMALSLFDLYTIQMPRFIQERVTAGSRTITGRSLAGSYVLGLLSALVVGACVSPLLVSALAVAITSHSATLGAAIMFSMALGMGVVLVALGVGAGYLLPKAGPWMNTVKHVFGVMLFGVAIYLLGLLPAVPVLLLWGALFVVVGVYLGGGRYDAQANGLLRLRAGLGALLLLWGSLSLVGGLQGNRDPLHPLTFRSAGVTKPGHHGLAFHKVTSLAALNRDLARAASLNEPALVDFSASWCVDCLQLARETFPDPRVQRALRGFMLIEADVTHNNAATRALKRKFGILGPPAVLFFSAQGRALRQKDFYGFKGPAALARLANEVKSI